MRPRNDDDAHCCEGRDKRVAVNEVVAGKMTMMPSAVSLADKLNGKETVTLGELIKSYREIIPSKNLSENTITRLPNRINQLESIMEDTSLDVVDIKFIHNLISDKAREGKFAIANQYRSLLIKIFDCGIVQGACESNPASLSKPSYPPKGYPHR